MTIIEYTMERCPNDMVWYRQGVKMSDTIIADNCQQRNGSIKRCRLKTIRAGHAIDD